MWRHVPIILATWEAEAGGLQCSKPAWTTK